MTTMGVRRPDQSAYMLRTAAMDDARAYKERLLRLLDLRPGQTVLDVGCGPATDLPALAERVGPGGQVIGVDRDPQMLAEARRRTGALPHVEVREGDAHELPVAPGSVDRAKIDRVLLHVADPAAVPAGLREATAPGAVVGLVEPDWETLIVDAEDIGTSRAFTRFVVEETVRNATVGRTLGRLAARAGFAVDTVSATTPVLRDVGVADFTLGLGRNLARAVAAGRIDADRARGWFTALGEGPFQASFTLFTVVARR